MASKGKRLNTPHAITRDRYLTALDPATSFPISEPALDKERCHLLSSLFNNELKGTCAGALFLPKTRDSRKTAEWVWPAKSKFKNYHDNTDSPEIATFEWPTLRRTISLPDDGGTK